MLKQKALLADTFVEKKDGLWCVFVEVIFEDEVIRKKVGAYFTKEKAEIAAKYIRRTINREPQFPYNDLGGCFL